MVEEFCPAPCHANWPRYPIMVINSISWRIVVSFRVPMYRGEESLLACFHRQWFVAKYPRYINRRGEILRDVRPDSIGTHSLRMTSWRAKAFSS